MIPKSGYRFSDKIMRNVKYSPVKIMLSCVQSEDLKRSPTMPRLLALTALLPLLLIATPAAAAVTAKEKADTCKVGADEQKLEGAKRKAFLAKCMVKGNYEPKARIAIKQKTVEVKRKPKPKAPVAAPAAAPVAAPAPAPAAAPPPPPAPK